MWSLYKADEERRQVDVETETKARTEEGKEHRVERGISALKPQIMGKIKRLFCEAQ